MSTSLTASSMHDIQSEVIFGLRHRHGSNSRYDSQDKFNTMTEVGQNGSVPIFMRINAGINDQIIRFHTVL